MLLRGLIHFMVAAALLSGTLPPAQAEEPRNGGALIEDFKMQPETRWRFFTDQVMGGVSTPYAELRITDNMRSVWLCGVLGGAYCAALVFRGFHSA